MDKKEIKKIEVYFNEPHYKSMVASYNEKLKIKDQIIDEVRRHFRTDAELKAPFFLKPLASFYIGCTVHLENPMKLSGEKLVDLYELDISKLKILCAKWSEVQDLERPNRDDYCLFAKTKSEIDKYNTANNLIKALNEAKQFLYNSNPYNLIQPFRNMVKLDMNSKLVVNPAFITS